MKRPRLSQRQREWLFVLALFLASTAFRFAMMGDYRWIIRIYPDELRYYQIAQSLAKGRGLMLNNQPTDFQKILYSLVLAPLFFVGNRALRMRLLGLLNAAVMSSGVVPVYLLARDLIKDRKRIFAACLLYVFSGDMMFTMRLMSEVLFLPLALWGVWGFCRLLVYRGGARGRRRLCAGLGAFAYVLYLCKEIALVFPLAYGLYAVVVLTHEEIGGGSGLCSRMKAYAVDLAVMAAAFLLPFALMKLTVFRGMGNSYDQSSVGVLFGPGRVRYMLYGFVCYLCGAVIAAGFVPLVLPLAFPGRLDEKAKKLLLFLLNLLVLSAAVVAYTIYVREDFDAVAPRPLLRYICYLFPAFMIVFLSQTERTEAIDRRRFCRALLGAALLVFMLCWFWPGETEGSEANFILLKRPESTLQDDAMIVVLLWGAVLLAGMALFAKRPGLTLCVYLAAFGAVQACGSAQAYDDFFRYSRSYADNETCAAVNRLSEMLDGCDEGNILFVPSARLTWRASEIYLNRPDLYQMDFAGIQELQGEEGIDLSEQRLPGALEGLRDVRYLVLPKAYDFDGSDLSDFKGTSGNGRWDYNLYDLHGATVLPRIRLWGEIRDGENVFDVTLAHFLSNYDPTENEFTAYAGQNNLLFGPYITLPAGEYDIIFDYRYEGELPSGSRLGYASLYGDDMDLSVYQSPLAAGETSVALRDVHIPKDCTNFETKMWADEPGVTVERVRIVKK